MSQQAFAVFILLSGLPTAIRLFVSRDDVHLAMGALAALYTVATLITARRVNATIVSSLELRFQNQDLVVNLNTEAAERVVGLVNDLGLQPVALADFPEEIDEDDLGVVCWMAVLPSRPI